MSEKDYPPTVYARDLAGVPFKLRATKPARVMGYPDKKKYPELADVTLRSVKEEKQEEKQEEEKEEEKEESNKPWENRIEIKENGPWVECTDYHDREGRFWAPQMKDGKAVVDPRSGRVWTDAKIRWTEYFAIELPPGTTITIQGGKRAGQTFGPKDLWELGLSLSQSGKLKAAYENLQKVGVDVLATWFLAEYAPTKPPAERYSFTVHGQHHGQPEPEPSEQTEEPIEPESAEPLADLNQIF